MEYLILETEDERIKLPVSKFKGFSDYDHKIKLSMSEEEILEVVQFGAENEYAEVKKLSRNNCCEDTQSTVYKLENFDIKKDSSTYEEILYYKSEDESYDYLEEYGDEEDYDDDGYDENFNIGYRYIEDEKDLDRDFGEGDFDSKTLYIIQCECGDWEIFID